MKPTKCFIYKFAFSFLLLSHKSYKYNAFTIHTCSTLESKRTKRENKHLNIYEASMRRAKCQYIWC